MGKMFIIKCFILITLSVGAQNKPVDHKIETIGNLICQEAVKTINEINQIPSELNALKKIEPISADPRDQNRSINYGKSKEIISVKAYIRILQMKRKETLMS